ncbi:polyprotein [Bobaya virus]|uniref:Envelopment polyprotein n=1 Tax=Bobaya virus TaxID=2818228 RepID=A0A8A2ICL4_9VIRU|nr:polyprotein [Bobaya virus]QSV51826.1 polyprotein [Bobaya virus]
MLLSIILCLIPIITAHPLSNKQIGDRCFIGGTLIRSVNQSTGIAEVCMKDDISMVKSIIISNRQSSSAVNNYIRYYRLFVVKEWHDCNPFPDPKGTFMVLDVDHSNKVTPIMYTCRALCDISLDKDSAEITLSSKKMNHYEIAGSTITNGWFKSTISVSLEHTCEHIKVSCGQKTARFHACFRQHRSCIRFFKDSFMPVIMVESICQNVEIILLTSFSLIVFILLCILTKTYIAYILIPLFYPFTYIYGKIYNKYFKLCPTCYLAIHPFTSCGVKCVCGALYNNTDQLKVHRMTNECMGYKALSKSRSLCKSKGCSFIVSIMLSVLFFSFITPVNSQEYKLSDLPDDYIRMEESIDYLKAEVLLIKIFACIVCFIIILLTAVERLIYNYFFNNYYRHCSLCGMIHRRKGLRIVNNTTNKCGTCECGYVEETEHGMEYEIFLKTMHQENENCKYKSSLRHFRNYKIIISILIISIMITNIAASDTETHCLKYVENIMPENLTTCHSLWLNITNCETNQSLLYNKLKGENLVTELDKSDFPIMSQKYDLAMERIENAQNLHHMILLEYLHAKSNCKRYSQLKSNAGAYNVPWRTFIYGHNLHICGQFSYKLVCKCISTGTHCENSDWDAYEELTRFYESNHENYNLDLNTLIKTISIAMRGVGQFVLNSMKSNETADALINFLNMTSQNLGTNKQLIGLIKFTIKLLNINQTKAIELDPEVSKIQVRSAVPAGEEVTNWTKGSSPIKKCPEYKTLTCMSIRKQTQKASFLLCHVSNRLEVFQWPSISTLDVGGQLCLGDVHCNLEFQPIDADLALKQLKCYKNEYIPISNAMDQSLTKCPMLKSGTCTTLNNHHWTVMMCNNMKIYQTNVREHAKDGSINNYCFEQKCSSGRHPIHETWFKSCTWTDSSRTVLEPRILEYHDIESYKKSIETDLKSDLTIHRFKPTKNLPAVVPKYISVTAEGVASAEGLQNAYIKGTIPAISGLATGIHINLPGSSNVIDLVIYIKKALYIADYRHIYTTGPTIGINVKHEEKCTGSCPSKIPKDDGWLTFSKEHTSNWGCEEFGCLAINTGCLYGSCQDIIKPELDIYKKIGEERVLIEVCITLPHETYCNDLDVLEPLITEKLQLDFQTVQSDHLPSILAVKKGIVYTGQINDLGNTAAMCGSVQIVNKTIFGTGNPKFDYLCHAAKRKDVIVRRCYDNHYMTCNLLQKQESYLYRPSNEGIAISINGKDLGMMNYRVNLGDVNYKLFTSEAQYTIKGSCAGCINCIEEISCQLEIITQSEFTCKLESECVLYTNNILINPSSHLYSIKLSCKDHKQYVEISVCSRKLSLPLSLKSHNQKLDLSSLDETNFIKEEDLRCGTWLCKVKDEGIGFIFGSLFGSLGVYWRYFMIGLVVLLLVLIVIFIFYPLCKRLKGVLEQNEREYMMEMKRK